jgi:hypothetical protein
LSLAACFGHSSYMTDWSVIVNEEQDHWGVTSM